MTAESGSNAALPSRVPAGDEEGTMTTEAQDVMVKWYRRPLYRWIFVGAVVAVILLVTVIAVIVSQGRSSAGAPLSGTSRPTPAPTSLTPEQSSAGAPFRGRPAPHRHLPL